MESSDEPEDSSRVLKTATTTLDIIDALKDLNGATLTEISDHLDISKGAAYNHLITLHENEFVVKKNDIYQLSPRFILLGEHARHEHLLYQFGKNELDELVEQTGEYAQLMTEEHGLAIVVYQSMGDKAIGSDYPVEMRRKPLHLHHTAAGKSILANLPNSRVDKIIEKYNLPKRTSKTITSQESLYNELEEVQERGYAYNKEEEVEGLRAVGAPIMGPDGSVLGALSLSGPKSRMDGDLFDEKIPDLVVNAADVIQVNINMQHNVGQL